MVNKKQQFQSLVIGGTGATGKCLLELLLKNEKCKKVTHIGRSPSEIDYKGDKLVDITIESMFSSIRPNHIGLKMIYFSIVLEQLDQEQVVQKVL